ncbi:MAG: EthD family reductase [Burkholderiaceae bacterium]|nr:EthD family reductase [Burkholderiaceae bacterium]
MIVRSGLIQKKPDWSTAEFRRYWRENHGALASKLPGLRRYQQNHVVDSVQRGITYKRGAEQLDGFSMLWFDSEDAMKAAIATEAGRALVADENHFIGDLRIVAIDQLEVIPPATDRPLLKRMSLLRRLPDVSPERFKHEWREEHARLVKRVSGVKGYRQNLIVHREAPKGTVVGYEGLPIDGIVELWFDDAASLDAAFATPQGVTLMTHAREFIGEITTFLVETHVVK